MMNDDKIKLKGIVMWIPEKRLKWKIVDLWRFYAFDFSYATFRKYLISFRKEKELKKK